MAVDMYLKIEGIKGDSTDSKHKDWIEVQSFTHSINQATGGATSAQGVMTGGRADHGDFSFVKRIDASTPTLAKFCCSGKPITKVEFELCRAMGDKTCFMKYFFEDSVISKVGPQGTSEGDDLIPLEEVGLRYGVIKWEYTPTDPKGGGKTGAAVKAGWSTEENKEVS